MKAPLVCKICGNEIATVHRYQRIEELRNHIKTHHPDEYEEICDMAIKINRLLDYIKNYGVGFNAMMYYRHDKGE